MKESEDGSISDLKTRVISSWADSSGREQLCQAANENLPVVFSCLQTDGRFGCDDERFADVECIFKEQLDGQTLDSVTSFYFTDFEKAPKTGSLFFFWIIVDQ